MEVWVAWLMGLFRSEHIEFALFAAAFISATVLPGGIGSGARRRRSRNPLSGG